MDTALATAERLVVGADSWEALPPMRGARWGAAAAADAACLYVLGGMDGSDRVLASVERYDPGAGAWETLPPLQQARHGLAAAALGGRLYAVGGGVEAGDECITLASAEFLMLEETDACAKPAAVWRDAPKLRVPRMDAVATVRDRCLFVVGGRCGELGTLVNSAERLDASVGSWQLERLPGPATPRLGAALAVAEGLLVSLGGYTGDFVVGQGHPSPLALAEALDAAAGATSWARLPPLLAPRMFAAAVPTDSGIQRKLKCS